MKLNLRNFRNNRTYWFIALIFVLLIPGSYYFVKELIVKNKWITLIEPAKLDRVQPNEALKTKVLYNLLNFKDNFSVEDSNNLHQTHNLYYSIRYSYQAEIQNIKKINLVGFGINYPTGFILRINNKVALTSPNLIIDTILNQKFIILPHGLNKINLTESFYCTGINLKNGLNNFEIEIISKNEIVKHVAPIQKIELYKNGFFLRPLFRKREDKPNGNINSELPKLYIVTKGSNIKDEPKVKATLQLSNNPVETINIKIEYRGRSSQAYNQPRKSYSFNTYNQNWSKNAVTLLNLPEESEWVLYAPYMDKSLMRNALAYYLSNRTGQYAPRYKYCDLYINQEFQGIYLLIEKPKISKNRIQKSFGNNNVKCFLGAANQPDLKEFGWYLFNKNNQTIYISIAKPKIDKITIGESNYIRKYLEDLNSEFNKKEISYTTIDSLIDINSLISFILINEISKNQDAYRLSTYFTKNYNKEGINDPLKIGPVWDFDFGFGNTYNGIFSQTTGWCYDSKTPMDIQLMINWPEIMLNDSVYKNKIRNKWFEYRKTFLSIDSIFCKIDDIDKSINSSRINYFNSLPIIDKWVYPNKYVGGSFENEIFSIKCWLIKRIYWMDNNLSNKYKYVR